MTRIATVFVALLLLSKPAQADYERARAAFERLPMGQQTAVALGLIAAGDFEALAVSGFTPELYQAIRRFERREGLSADGILRGAELRQLIHLADDFYERLGARFYDHPVSGVRLLVPRRLFDAEKEIPDGLLFTKLDGGLSLLFISVPETERSYDVLWATLSRQDEGKQIIYQRRFASRFVVTGYFGSSKFYTMMARTGRNTTGFTFSWGAPYEALGRKVSTFLANVYLAELR